MKTVILLLAALLLIKTSAAFGNEACQQGYVDCVGACVSARHSQEPCIEKCQIRNKACYSGMFGGQPVVQQEAQRPPEEASAQTEDRKPAKGASKKSTSQKKAVPARSQSTTSKAKNGSRSRS